MRQATASNIKLLSILFGFAATLMILLPALTVGDSNVSYTGLQVVFGHQSFSVSWLGSGEIQFSFLNLIAYFLPLAGALTLIFTKTGHVIASIMFGGASVLLFFVPTFTVVTLTVLENPNVVSVDWKYALGLIIAISLSIIACIISVSHVLKSR